MRASTIAGRSALVADTVRKSERTERLLPSGSNVCSCSTRSIFTWHDWSRSPISSRNTVPLSATAKRP